MTSMNDTTVSEILERFGGPEVVAERFGLGPKAVWQWERRGIPGKWHLPLLRWAGDEGWREELEQGLSGLELSQTSRGAA